MNPKEPPDSGLSLASLIDALDSLNEGFALFDAEDRLLLANQRARELFPETAVAMQPGARYEDLLRLLVGAGGVLDAAGREDEWIAHRLELRRERRGVEQMRRPGGRSIKIVENSTPGGGSVLIYRDFTELRRREDELATANRVIGHSERLAALGELIAGITHEIKNSLSLMSNFSEVCGDIVEELRTLLAPPLAGLDDAQRAEVQDLLDTLAGNLATIVQHGERADSIVKSMLQSSRTDGTPVLTDINRLVDEALMLAHYGTHARTPGFKVQVHRSLDASAGSAAIQPQEITRVLLNLFSNSFHALHRRLRDSSGSGWQPQIWVQSRGDAGQVRVTVRDNGTGIRPADLERVFTRFFTTKPAGEGTGLGLALCKDIVKRHHGSLTVASELGDHAEFALELPRSRPAEEEAR